MGLGCNNFGWRIDAASSAAAVNAALDAGINFFDTADIYGAGASEEFLGRALRSRRGEVLIATKFGMKMDEQRRGARPEYVHGRPRTACSGWGPIASTCINCISLIPTFPSRKRSAR